MSIEFVIDSKALFNIMESLEPVRDKSDFSETNYSFFGFYVKEKSMEICSKCEEMSAKSHINSGENLNIISAGNFGMFGKGLTELLLKFPTGQITFKADKSDKSAMKELGTSLGVDINANCTITIYLPDSDGKALKSEKHCYRFIGILDENIPTIHDNIKGKSIEIDRKIFNELVKKSILAASKDVKEEDNFRAIRIEFSKKGVSFIATDGGCLSLCSNDTEQYEEAVCQLYATSLYLANRIIPEKETNKIKFIIGENKTALKANGLSVLMSSAGSIDSYVDYKKFTDRSDSQTSGKCIINKEKFNSLLDRISKTTDCETVFHFAADESYVKTENGVIRCHEDLKGSIEEYTGENNDFVFNFSYLQNALKIFDNEPINVRFFGSNVPIEMKTKYNKFLILPMLK